MVYRKRTYKDVTDPKILEIWEEVKDATRQLYPQYFEYCTPELYHNDSYSHLGYCSQSYYNPNVRHVDKLRADRCIILLSTKLGQDYDGIRDTICHELGHFVTPGEHHSYLWKVRSDKIGKRWGIEVGRLSSNETFRQAAVQAKAEIEKRNPYKYRLYCPDCGAEWKYKSNCRAVKYPQLYSCCKCKINLQSEKI